MLQSLTKNWLLKLLSLVFAVVLWFFVMGERKLEVGYAVPLELTNVPPGLMVANEVPTLVDVRISGPRTLLMNLRPSDISIEVDLKDLEPGLTTFKRLEERLNIPTALRVTRLSPSFIDVKLDRIREKSVPVRVQTTGAPASGVHVVSVKALPAEAVVEGAESELKDIGAVVTDPVSIDGVRESFSLIAPLSHSGKFTILKSPKTVEVQVAIQPVKKSKKGGTRRTTQ